MEEGEAYHNQQQIKKFGGVVISYLKVLNACCNILSKSNIQCKTGPSNCLNDSKDNARELERKQLGHF